MRPAAGWLLPLMGSAIVKAATRCRNQTKPQEMTEGPAHILINTTMSNTYVFPHRNEQVVPDTKRCPACGKPFGAEVLAC